MMRAGIQPADCPSNDMLNRSRSADILSCLGSKTIYAGEKKKPFFVLKFFLRTSYVTSSFGPGVVKAAVRGEWSPGQALPRG